VKIKCLKTSRQRRVGISDDATPLTSLTFSMNYEANEDANPLRPVKTIARVSAMPEKANEGSAGESRPIGWFASACVGTRMAIGNGRSPALFSY
jgi:hypothetical protein